MADCFPKQLSQFTLPPAMQESFDCLHPHQAISFCQPGENVKWTLWFLISISCLLVKSLLMLDIYLLALLKSDSIICSFYFWVCYLFSCVLFF
jgi:hypothetical protein